LESPFPADAKSGAFSVVGKLKEVSRYVQAPKNRSATSRRKNRRPERAAALEFRR